MPFSLAVAAAIASIVGAGTAVGSTIYNDVNKPGTPAGPTPTQLTNQAINAETANRATATKEAAQILPDLQANTGGGLSPDAYGQLSSQFSGNANLGSSPQVQEMVNKFLGIDPGASFGGSSPFGGGSSGTNPLAPGLTGGGG
jgi:hypothetical protein